MLDITVYLFVGLLEMLHEDGNHDVDKDELGHEDEHDEKHGSDVLIDAAIPQAILGVVTLFPQRILHYPVPVVPYTQLSPLS